MVSLRTEFCIWAVIDERHAQDFWESLKAERSGATILCVGEDRGTNLAARLIALPNHHFDIAKEEIFGPALVLIPYSDFSAESILFDLKSTLQGAVFTDDDSYGSVLKVPFEPVPF